MGIMTPLGQFTYACAALLLLTKANGVATADTISYDVKVEKESSCITDINKARQVVGFADLVQATDGTEGKRLPDGVTGKPEAQFTGSAWEPVCKVLLPKSGGGPAARTSITEFQSGTYAFKSLESDSPECSTIVEEWKGSYKNFNGLPPPYSKDTELYKDQNNVSFVAMYNPSSGATADCRVVTCTKKTQTGTRALARAAPRNGDLKVETGYALICMTVPDVLPKDKSTAPFTEDQWSQIVTAFEGSASTVLPSLLALAAAALCATTSLL
ncbi:SAG family member [Eimeria brunetti]|uniref:SAG family member n=1 Tax=Eimeria brunetti TaxID=51314 RepID=U6L5I0_9EIME|nr:SAG family member [Eimeria brunetti]